METIAHQVWINAGKEKVYDAVTSTDGLSGWWHPDCTAKAEVGFVNIFRSGGHVHNKMLIVDLKPNEFAEWECINDNGVWTGTHLSFEIIEKQGVCILNFKHSGWESATEFFTVCNFHWARHLLMLKALCETGKSQVVPEEEVKWGDLYKK
ncbi:MAG: SRPBCC family protein [Mucilaginibacter sp.]